MGLGNWRPHVLQTDKDSVQDITAQCRAERTEGQMSHCLIGWLRVPTGSGLLRPVGLGKLSMMIRSLGVLAMGI